MLAKPNWNWWKQFCITSIARWWAIAMKYALHIYRTDDHCSVLCTCTVPTNYCNCCSLSRCHGIDTTHILCPVHRSSRICSARIANLLCFLWKRRKNSNGFFVAKRFFFGWEFIILLACDAASGNWIAWTTVAGTFHALRTNLQRFAVVAIVATVKWGKNHQIGISKIWFLYCQKWQLTIRSGRQYVLQGIECTHIRCSHSSQIRIHNHWSPRWSRRKIPVIDSWAKNCYCFRSMGTRIACSRRVFRTMHCHRIH